MREPGFLGGGPMRCPACGYIGFDHVPTCKQCGKALPRLRMESGSVAPVRPAARIASRRMGRGSPGADRLGEGEPLASATVEPAGAPPPASPVPEDTGAPESSIARADLGALRKAGFWRRAVALLVDLAIVLALVASGGMLVALAVQVGGWFSSTPEVALEWLEESARRFLVVLIALCYFTLFVGFRGQTPGKMLLGLRIIRVTGEEVGYGRAFVRWIGQILGLLPLGIGFLMVVVSRKQQGLHDKLAGTYVVRLP